MPKSLFVTLLPLVLIVVMTSVAASAASGEPKTEEEILEVEGEVQAPVKVSATPPLYTKKAKEEGTEGAVIIKTVVDTEGDVKVVEVLQSQPHGLTEVAVEAVDGWRFEPATLHGEPVKVYYTVTVNFRLGKDKGKE